MKIIANCCDMRMEIPCGAGKQHMRWLGLVVATRMQREKYPHAFRVPVRVLSEEGQPFRPRDVISEKLRDGQEVTVELRHGASILEDEVESEAKGEWFDEAYGRDSNLMECKFRWPPPATGNLAPINSIPKLVKGRFQVAPSWRDMYDPKEYAGCKFDGSQFELPIDVPGDEYGAANDNFDWRAVMKGPPGTCTYSFMFTPEQHQEEPETIEREKVQYRMEFKWDVPIAEEPYPEIDSRPSTASSRDGAQVDPRFEQDWEAMRLKWVESFMKVRVKDVLTEFYAILIDLFDSYAFMGLDLSASQHTIGMDDWKHLIINCGLLTGQPEGSLAWREVCNWFEEAASVRDGRPYLAQRLTRAQYLELLMRTAGWAMCEHPRKQYVPDPGRPPMPLDEGLFRFITDILIPVMDIYDDDPIRKDAVQHHNLVVIQQSRPSIRSIYAFLGRPWPFCDNEKVVVPETLKFVLEYVSSQLQLANAPAPEAEESKKEGEEAAKATAGPTAPEMLSGEDKLDLDQINIVLAGLDAAVDKVTENHPEIPDHRALLFWEFFEVLMQCCREMDQNGTALKDGIPAFVQTMLTFTELADQGEVVIPELSLANGDQGDPEEDED